MEIHYQLSSKEIYAFLQTVDSSFQPALSLRLDLELYSKKLYEKAKFIGFKEGNRVISGIFYYINPENQSAYIPVLGTVSGYEGKGLMKILMDKLELYLISEGILSMGLETWLGSRALNIYIKKGFHIISTEDKPEENRVNVILQKNLNNDFPSFSFTETAIETNTRLNKDLGISLFMKRDDLFPVIGGGSKARKLKFILNKAISNGCTAVVTAGSNYSNHLRATAVLCAELGLKFSACIHDQKPESHEIKGNLKLTLDLSHRHQFVEMKDIKVVMDNEINKFISEGEKPLYIWGGGHSIEGTYSYYDATVNTLQEMEVVPDYIFVASGTGTTQAGILLAVEKNKLPTQVIGVSVAREEVRGKKAIEEALKDIQPYLQNLQNLSPSIIFDDQFLLGGYGSSNSELNKFLIEIAKKYGWVLDPVYSGKAFYGMWSYIKSGRIKPGSNVLFWNTGGILNI